ncbi:MAG: methyltransferase domain-containing protein [Alkalinema sp. RU_4_3]|nr:methyltransferase domain-containing protein [Alkalinema sp. RU_4_3]
MNFLNLGCGRRFNEGWTNIDFTSSSKFVLAHNLTQGIPNPDESFDVVYHSHVLEHFSQAQAQAFLKECFRVLKPGGVIRVVIPDLEQIAQNYLVSLEKAEKGILGESDNHHWMIVEMLDQSVRNHSGGEMAAYLTQEHIPNQAFVLDRIGTEGKNLIEAGKQRHQQSTSAAPNWLKPIYRFVRYPHYRRDAFLKLCLGQSDYEALKIGQFRLGGEIHQWMYDRYSLKRTLENTGFIETTQQTANQSRIADWVSFNLDTEPDGSTYKPDSLFMEAIKPAP